MSKFYKYKGTVSSFRYDNQGCGSTDLILADVLDWEKPPVRLTAFGALAKYIYDIEMTDAEERYIKADWYYDRNLFLHRIEIPSSNEYKPAKVITQDDCISKNIEIFGPREYIQTNKPDPMSNEEIQRWCAWKWQH